MGIIEKIIGVIAPHSCIGCEAEENRLLCESCRLHLPMVPSRCYRCRATTDEYRVCAACSAKTPLRQVIAYTYYEDLAKALVHRTKYERAQSGAAEMADLLAEQLAFLPEGAILAHVPTATSRVRSRGYDHARLITTALSGRSGLRSGRLLARVGQAHQVGARRSDRLRQLQTAFRPLNPALIRGRTVVLVDDVLTTGATLETAARALRRAGAAEVRAIVFAQA